MKSKKIFLFSIDLEDVRDGVKNGHLYKDSVVRNSLKFLEWLSANNFNCTFFVVGTVAERYPDLLREIISRGHEIACHSYSHTPLSLHTRDSFKQDLEKNIEALAKCGAGEIKGFRAPVFSLTKKTSWVHEVLSSCGITYSSSILPAENPLFGWKEFGALPKKVKENLIEFPMTLKKFGPVNVPFAGGVYFRCLPFWFVKSAFHKTMNEGKPVLGYFHPYDADTEQEKFMHGGINNSRFYNLLMYYNRKNLFNRLNKLLQPDVTVMTFREYINSEFNGV